MVNALDQDNYPSEQRMTLLTAGGPPVDVILRPVSTPSAATIAGLPTAPTNGSLTWVTSVRSFFVARAGSTLVPDGITVIAYTGGNWERLPVPSISWAVQANWYIAPGTGSDENPGSSDLPIRTWEELRRRLDGQTLYQTTTVTLLATSIPEYLRLKIDLAQSTTTPFKFIVQGGADQWAPIAGGAGAFSAVTAINRATNTPQSVTDAALAVDPATFVGHRIRLTSGANIGATAWVMKKISATEFRTTPFSTAINPATVTSNNGIVAPAINDQYQVEDVVGILGADIQVQRLDSQDAAGALVTACVVLDSVDVQKGLFTANALNDGYIQLNVSLSGTGAPLITRSRLHALCVVGFRLAIVGCMGSMQASGANSWGAQQLNAGGTLAVSGTATFTCGGIRINCQYTNDFLSQGCGINFFGPVTVGALGIFDGPNNAFSVANDSSSSAQATGILYGSGNAGVAVNVPSGHLYNYSAAGTKPTITGSVPGTNDAAVGGVNKAWAAIPFTDTAKMCGIVVV